MYDNYIHIKFIDDLRYNHICWICFFYLHL